LTEEFITVLTPIISIIIGVGTLGGFMYKIGDWINKKAELKATLLKASNDTIAFNLKQQNENTAANLKIVTESVADGVKHQAESTAENLKRVTVDQERVVKEYTDKTVISLKSMLDIVDEKVMTMLQDLANRSDMVDGNVGNIRKDISELQEDIIDLYSSTDIEYERDSNGREVEVDTGTGRDSMSSRKNRKRIEIQRRRKKRDIEEDENAQKHPLYGKGRK
jgi:hypothetical protein